MAEQIAANLQSFGITPLSSADGAVHFALLRMARRLAQAERKVIALVPATERVGVVGVAVQLALAMIELNVSPVAVVDANPHLPAFAALVPSELRNSEGFVSLSVQDGFVVTTRATPTRRNTTGEETLEHTILAHRKRFARILVDLTGFRELGEHLAAYDLVDGICILAERGRTRESSVEKCAEEIPKAQSLGVLLIG